MADQNAAFNRAFDVNATTPHLLGITPQLERGGVAEST
ncbi:hypothetical protein SynA18461_00433 [Synechococcus sp. A18-46.1]|nr:hypothetical protein SynA18461_00433 [Synechococcus sp. A18-46.1]